MATGLLYENEAEEKLHHNAIQAIAKEMKIPVYKVTSIYEITFERLKEHAKVKDFLPIFVRREVKEMLSKRSLSGPKNK